MKKWKYKLIKALGGYTVEEFLFRDRPVVKQYEKIPLRLTSVCTYPKDMLIPAVKENAEYRLAAELAKRIIEEKLYTLREEDGYDPRMARYIMTVEILPPMDGW